MYQSSITDQQTQPQDDYQLQAQIPMPVKWDSKVHIDNFINNLIWGNLDESWKSNEN